jgi:hypothetical protein
MINGLLVAHAVEMISDMIERTTAMRLPDLIRYGLWCGIVTVAEANRREYTMTTTWLPHLVTNTVSLMFPNVYRLLAPRLAQQLGPSGQHAWIHDTLTAMVCDNPRYVLYVTPLAAGYLLSSPWLNIYKGDLARIRLAGFGLDAFPHVATAFALTLLVHDTFGTAAQTVEAGNTLAPVLQSAERHAAALSAVVLALATLVWEYGEYRIYIHEMAQRGDPERINMQWSVADTLSDCISNAFGWCLAIGLSYCLTPFGRRRYSWRGLRLLRSRL